MAGKQYYILWSSPIDAIDDVLFGPFKSKEVNERLGDPFADLLERSAGEVSVIRLSKQQAKWYAHVHSKTYWMQSLSWTNETLRTEQELSKSSERL